jgi:hypothetical protein
MADPKAAKPYEPDKVEKFLAELQTFESRREEMIKEVLRQKEASINAFDGKLSKLCCQPNARSKRSHHKQHATKGDFAPLILLRR